MKIESSYKTTTTPISVRSSSPQSTSVSTQDEVSLSSLAGSLQSGEQIPVNSAKIQEIKQAISEGRFKINPGAIADRLIESARDLVSSQSKSKA
jgi:negative regulator of flagellin synthesis FlgM